MARRYLATAICVLVVGTSIPALSETDLLVDGFYCGRLAQLVWRRRQVHALECAATRGPLASPEPAPSKLFVGNTMVGYVCDLAQGRDLQGLDCQPRFGEPGTERLPTPTPRPKAALGSVADWLVPSASASEIVTRSGMHMYSVAEKTNDTPRATPHLEVHKLECPWAVDGAFVRAIDGHQVAWDPFYDWSSHELCRDQGCCE